MADRYRSETDKYRNDMAPFCIGDGIDIGYGGDPIISSAITIDNPDGLMANCGDHPINLSGDARNLVWFKDSVLDYVYSSHCLEDFENTREILLEWLRVLKQGGRLVLLLPNQKRYEEHCLSVGEQPNASHKIKEFGLDYIKAILATIPSVKILFEKDIVDDYNFQIVIMKTDSNVFNQELVFDKDNKIEKLMSELKKQKDEYETLNKNIELLKRSKFFLLRSIYMKLRGKKDNL
jgi:ubiquinone/menaquinone biosynthesis C-methylase UbiE